MPAPRTMRHAIASIAAVTLLAVIGCERGHKSGDGHGGHHAAHGDKAMVHQHQQMFTAINEAVAVLHSTSGNSAAGWVRFVEADGKVTVTAEITGLNANQQHAIHVHEFGDCSAPDAMSAGGHYNPEGHPHALPNGGPRHAGDFGNLKADANGKATFKLVVDNLTIAGLKNPVIGRAVIVHAKPDDGGQPVGNAGARIACGVIGVAKK